MKELSAVPFTFDLELKAAEGNVVEVLEDGDLLIEGWGATLDVDREDEAFTDNAFTKGLKAFLSGSAPLCWHHKYDQVIGRVVEGEIVPGKGVWIKAIVDRQPETSPLYHAYQAIKRGRANGFSCGGVFKRIATAAGPRINHVDLLEWSATATPVGSTALFSVVAGKALEFKAGEEVAEVTNEEVEIVEAPVDEVVEETPEQKEERETEEARVAQEAAAAEEVVKPVELESGSVTSEHIAPGSITAEHFSDDLRSHFTELKPGPSLDDLAAALNKFDATLTQVAEHVGFGSGSEGDTGNDSVAIR